MRIFWGIGLILVNVAGWAIFAAGNNAYSGLTFWRVFFDVWVIACYLGVSTVAVARRNASPVEVVFALFSGASVILFVFANLYLEYGTKENFGTTLTRPDALYFALGTFTTAGTGSIAPVSEAARIAVSCQYAVDLIYAAGTITIGIAQITSRVGKAERGA